MGFSPATGQYESSASFRGASLTLDATPGLFRGRCYRAYKEFTGATVLRLVASTPFMLTAQVLFVDTGQARCVVSTGGTPGGTFTTLPTVFNKNGVVVAPAPSAVLTQGGTVSAGTEREVLRVNAGGGQGAITSLAGVRYLPAGTYYISISVTGSTSGMYSIEYEELIV